MTSYHPPEIRSSFPFPHKFGNYNIDQSQFPDVLLPTTPNALTVKQFIHDQQKPLHQLVISSTSLLADLANLVVDYSWHHPPQYSRVPLSAINNHGVDSVVSTILKGVDYVFDPRSGFSLTFETPIQRFLHARQTDIGRIGFEDERVLFQISKLFVVVWVHPSQQMYGVIYPAMSITNSVLSFLDAYYPVVLTTTNFLSTSPSRFQPKCALFLQNQPPPSLSKCTCQFKNTYEMKDFHILGEAPPYCYITPQMYPTLDSEWWDDHDRHDHVSL